jgi:UDP-N-acetylglucosamine--N-acetylmuramyl-(pentapeptide) pyrophosphoryl-undecaprenol N-acetylglucosamine transferase
VTAGHFPATAPVEVTGCPVRPAFRATHRRQVGEILRSFELDPNRRTLLVTGASQGARTINETMMQLAHTLDFCGWQVLHLAGPADADRVTRAYASPGSGPGTGRLPGRVLAFTDRMADAMSAADLIISRAGASTLAEILAIGRPSILLPYPYHRDQHQRHNAMVLAEAGAAVLVEDARSTEINVGRLGAVLGQLMKNDPRRSAMGAAARELGRPRAADRIARRVAQAAQNLRGHACEFSGGEPVKSLPRRTA